MAKQKEITTASSSERLHTKQTSGRRLHGVALFSVLAALMLTLLLEALDQTVVGTAMPRIIGALQGFDRYTWVVTAYLLTSTTMVPLVGKLSDQFGRKWFLIAGTLIFLLGSALSGAAQTMDQLIAFRAIQGFGAGVGIALISTLVGDIFPPQERAMWGGIFGAVYGFSSLVGPSLGGWLTDHGPLLGTLVGDTTRWRWVFYINLPLGIVALAALLIYLPANISERSTLYTGWAAIRRVDFLGALLACAATICLLLGLTWGGDQTYDWSSLPVVGTLVAAGVLYIAFIIAERFAVEPILPLSFFRNQVFAADIVLSLLQNMILLGLMIYLPFFLQGVLGASATLAGVVTTPMSVSMVVGATLSGMVVALLKRYQVVTILGAIIMSIGVFLMTRMTISTSLLEAVIYMVIAGIGIGVFFSIMNLVAQNALPRASLGVGTAAVRYLGQIGGTMGIAIVGSVVNRTLSDDLAQRLPASTVQQLTPAGVKFATNPQVLVNQTYHDTVVHTAEQIAVSKAVAHVPAGPQHAQIAASVAAQVMQQVDHMLAQVFATLKLSLTVAVQHGFIAVLGFCILVLVTTFFLKDVPMVQQSSESTDSADEAEERSDGAEDVPVMP